mmetsp:Transcript_35193/g.26258  ORF Transcript_35193/g.26258 Transcript_35193/m.26258 type:complete len:106 (+) Transcript_35193:424-741(+)
MAEAFDKEKVQSQASSIAMRVLAFILMFLGIYLALYPFLYLLTWIPVVGVALAFGVNITVAILSFLLSLVLAFSTIGLAWLVYKPQYALAMFTIAVLFMMAIFLI